MNDIFILNSTGIRTRAYRLEDMLFWQLHRTVDKSFLYLNKTKWVWNIIETFYLLERDINAMGPMLWRKLALWIGLVHNCELIKSDKKKFNEVK